MFQKQHTNNIENTSISISDFILSLLVMDGTHFYESFGWFDSQWYC